eukprot:TRINITY_DN2281_c1_g1_i1.p3 TRINITY_DN2281_c1_g1~~TRINITY_DN2281_c1_g1_i1.p3  ORF type:complete len:227 (+),score=92.93 TRINITY_DN2281_c1_g1_i1:158-838(+)
MQQQQQQQQLFAQLQRQQQQLMQQTQRTAAEQGAAAKPAGRSVLSADAKPFEFKRNTGPQVVDGLTVYNEEGAADGTDESGVSMYEVNGTVFFNRSRQQRGGTDSPGSPRVFESGGCVFFTGKDGTLGAGGKSKSAAAPEEAKSAAEEAKSAAEEVKSPSSANGGEGTAAGGYKIVPTGPLGTGSLLVAADADAAAQGAVDAYEQGGTVFFNPTESSKKPVLTTDA